MPSAEVKGSLSDLDALLHSNVAQLAEHHRTETQPLNHLSHEFAGTSSHFSSASDEIDVAFVFYTIGIPNNVILGSAWNQANSEEQKRLRDDIETIFEGDLKIQCLFLNGFGQMDVTIDAILRSTRGVLQPPTQQYFQELVPQDQESVSTQRYRFSPHQGLVRGPPHRSEHVVSTRARGCHPHVRHQ